jgi:hypothetical protein
VLELDGEVVVVRGDYGGGRKTLRDLCRDVGPGEDGDRTVPHERRQPTARARIETLRQAEDGRRSGQVVDDLAERTAGNGDNDELGVLHGAVLPLPAEDLDVVATVAQDVAEDGAPGSRVDDGGLHDRRTKSMETGIPCMSKRSRSLFSTQ